MFVAGLGLRLADVLDSHPRSVTFVAVIRLRAFATVTMQNRNSFDRKR